MSPTPLLKPLFGLSMLMLLIGCRGKSVTPPPDFRQPLSATFTSDPFGIQFDLPPGWFPRPSPDHILLLVPRPSDGSPDASISLDVPDLPMHIPGLIPIGLVRNGYLDDLRNRFPTLQTRDDTPPPIPRAQSRLVHSTWQLDGRRSHETALLMVHGDRVYILRANVPDAAYNDTLAAFNAIASSIRWTK